MALLEDATSAIWKQQWLNGIFCCSRPGVGTQVADAFKGRHINITKLKVECRFNGITRKCGHTT